MKKKPFDPWTATAEEAIEESRNGNENAVFQWQAASDIQALRPEIEGAMALIGEKKKFTNKEKKEVSIAGYSVLRCVRKLVTYKLVAPEWLAHAYNQRFDAVNNLRAKEWADFLSFGEPFYSRKAEHLKLYKKAEIFFIKIADELEKEREKGTFKKVEGKNRISQYDFLEDRFLKETGEVVGAEVWQKIIYKRSLVRLMRSLIKKDRRNGRFWHSSRI
jgi:hypothetical protein